MSQNRNILDQYVDRKAVQEVRVDGFEKKVKVYISSNGGCSCHPETCCHWAYTFTAKGVSWQGDSYSDYREVVYRLKDRT